MHVNDPAQWAVAGYRLSHWLWRRHLPFAARFVAMVLRVLSGAEISPRAEIGRGFRIAHGFGVVIGEDAHIGDDCAIMQGVTLGMRGPTMRVPTLGNRVFVGVGAILLGPITIGDDAKIGAGAVVLCDVPAGCTAVGNPARVLRPKGEREAAATSTRCP